MSTSSQPLKYLCAAKHELAPIGARRVRRMSRQASSISLDGDAIQLMIAQEAAPGVWRVEVAAQPPLMDRPLSFTLVGPPDAERMLQAMARSNSRLRRVILERIANALRISVRVA